MVEVPPLKPDEQGELAVPFVAPSAPGRYERYVIVALKKIKALANRGIILFRRPGNLQSKVVLR